jgi:hypothetical protein
MKAIKEFKIWDNELKKYVRFNKLDRLKVHYDSEVVRVKDNKRYELHFTKDD